MQNQSLNRRVLGETHWGNFSGSIFGECNSPVVLFSSSLALCAVDETASVFWPLWGELQCCKELAFCPLVEVIWLLHFFSPVKVKKTLKHQAVTTLQRLHWMHEFTSTFVIWNSQTPPVLIVSSLCDFIKMFKSVYADIKIDSYICQDSKKNHSKSGLQEDKEVSTLNLFYLTPPVNWRGAEIKIFVSTISQEVMLDAHCLE